VSEMGAPEVLEPDPLDESPRWASRDALHLALQNVTLALDEYLVHRVDADVVRDVVQELLDELGSIPADSKSGRERSTKA
jgi:hypothetical protein